MRYDTIVEKYNDNHDPATGRFTSGPGGGKGKAAQSAKYSKKDQIAAIEDWSDGGYGYVRAAQTGKTNDPKRKAQAEAIEQYIEENKGKETGYLARGISTDEPLKLKPGQELDMNGTSSWSKSDEVAEEFAQFDDNKYLFVATDGITKAADISKHAMNPDEQEVIVSKDARLKIDSVQYDYDSDITVVVVKEVE